jgi:Fur family ferric uptake transcriptional regulator
MTKMRQTRQRAAILELLRSLKSHPTAAELHALVRKRLPRISLGTVYRNLDALARQGRIRKLVSGRAEARFDGDLRGHYHVRCTDCGRVGDVFGLELPNVDSAEPGRASGFEILGCRLEFIGVCPECRRRRTSPHDRASGTETDARVPVGLKP